MKDQNNVNNIKIIKKKGKPRGRGFQKGVATNPKGRPPLPPDLRAARAMETEKMLRAVIKVRNSTADDIKKIDLNQCILGEVAIMRAYLSNDPKQIKDYEDRLFGKAPETFDITSRFDKPEEDAAVRTIVEKYGIRPE